MWENTVNEMCFVLYKISTACTGHFPSMVPPSNFKPIPLTNHQTSDFVLFVQEIGP